VEEGLFYDKSLETGIVTSKICAFNHLKPSGLNTAVNKPDSFYCCTVHCCTVHSEI
jgi:hypothetical protein